MMTQKEMDSTIKLARTALKQCYGLKSLTTLQQNFELLGACCATIEKELREAGYIGVGLIIELFPKE